MSHWAVSSQATRDRPLKTAAYFMAGGAGEEIRSVTSVAMIPALWKRQEIQEVLPRQIELEESRGAHNSFDADDCWSSTDADEQIIDYDPLIGPTRSNGLPPRSSNASTRSDITIAMDGLAQTRRCACVRAYDRRKPDRGGDRCSPPHAVAAMAEGLDRHTAIHAIGSVLAAHLNDLLRSARSGTPPA